MAGGFADGVAVAPGVDGEGFGGGIEGGECVEVGLSLEGADAALVEGFGIGDGLFHLRVAHEAGEHSDGKLKFLGDRYRGGGGVEPCDQESLDQARGDLRHWDGCVVGMGGGAVHGSNVATRREESRGKSGEGAQVHEVARAGGRSGHVRGAAASP